ncbi:hypothetical protein [Aquimarina algicola]|uniref:Uncharacterized protein n=1 Tax=Aquimarina algicola TaxID=2589995 RepID=A0A504J9I9_9FLAO|nr:hypothetical protein [Aquimarina algicola]TPN85265.1 hypothetical protein FHK87_14670 [Aquimarina algicola]
MKNPFWKIKSILIVLLIPVSLFLILISILLISFNENNEYLISLFLIPSGILLFTYSLKYVTKTNKSFKNDLIVYLNDDSRLIELFHYEEKEWYNFAKKYYQKRIKNYTITSCILIPIITFFMIFIYKENYELFILLSFLFFSIFTFISIVLRKSLIEFKSKLFDSEKLEAKITTSGILINKSYIVSYNNQDGWLTRCTSKVFINMKCLEFEIKRLGGKGHNYQYFNLLIPKEREQDSKMIESRISEYAIPKTKYNNT